jgi:hypothetical protein
MAALRLLAIQPCSERSILLLFAVFDETVWRILFHEKYNSGFCYLRSPVPAWIFAGANKPF